MVPASTCNIAARSSNRVCFWVVALQWLKLRRSLLWADRVFTCSCARVIMVSKSASTSNSIERYGNIERVDINYSVMTSSTALVVPDDDTGPAHEITRSLYALQLSLQSERIELAASLSRPKPSDGRV